MSEYASSMPYLTIHSRMLLRMLSWRNTSHGLTSNNNKVMKMETQRSLHIWLIAILYGIQDRQNLIVCSRLWRLAWTH